MFFAFIVSSLLFSPFSVSVNASIIKPMTDLGHIGNLFVAKEFSDYKRAFSKNNGCKSAPESTVHRVIVTGFGLFSGVNYNISGAVISSMADASFYPSIIDPAKLPDYQNQIAHDGIIKSHSAGVTIANRSMQINGKLFDVCFITANVEWDFASAVFLDQATQFKPELILMTGRGTSEVSLEVGALNNATQSTGFDPNGKPETNNRPVSDGAAVLEEYPIDSTLALTWSAEAVNSAIRPLVDNLGYQVIVQNEARSENNYICNNVSFVVANASQNKETRLAGGELILPNPNFKTLPKVGFFHFPSVDSENPNAKNYSAQIFQWSHVMARAIVSQFE